MPVKVSVVIPTYNRAEFILEAIESVLNQTYKDYEIIVVDDGSTDNTRQLVQSYADKVKYYYQAQNGVSSARNHGIKVAQGHYIAFLDSDDKFLPHKLEKQIAALKNKPKIGLIYSPHIIWDSEKDESKLSKTKFLSGFQPRKMLSMCMSGPFTVPTVMIPKHVFDEVGNFDESMDLAEDIDMWCRIAQRFELSMLNEPLSIVRRHPGNSSGRTHHERNLRAWLHIAEKIFTEYQLYGFWYKQRLYSRMYLTAAKTAKGMDILRLIFIAIVQYPLIIVDVIEIAKLVRSLYLNKFR